MTNKQDKVGWAVKADKDTGLVSLVEARPNGKIREHDFTPERFLELATAMMNAVIFARTGSLPEMISEEEFWAKDEQDKKDIIE